MNKKAESVLFSPRKPRYVALAEEITENIGKGSYAVGTLLPSEAELCTQHCVSRHTVREAVRLLQELGLVTRQQGLGTRIRSDKVASRYVLAMDAIPDLWQYVKNTQLKVGRHKVIQAGNALTPLPGADENDRWNVIEAVRHSKSGEPIAWKQVYIDSRYSKVTGDIGRRQIPIYALIEERYGIKTVSVKQEISAVAIPKEVAGSLRVKAGSSGLMILRHYIDSEEHVFEVTMSVYPANRFRYSIELRLEYGNGGSGRQ